MINIAHIVLCTKCGQKFDRDKIPFEPSGSRRYAHKQCPSQDPVKQQEIEELNKLEEYIKKLFDETYINPRVRQQISNYKEQYHFTYSGMLKTLIYFFEIRGNDIAKAQGGIGIVPYIYKEASKYYYELHIQQKLNQDKNFLDFKPKVKEIVILSPKLKPSRKILFNFLEEEE